MKHPGLRIIFFFPFLVISVYLKSAHHDTYFVECPDGRFSLKKDDLSIFKTLEEYSQIGTSNLPIPFPEDKKNLMTLKAFSALTLLPQHFEAYVEKESVRSLWKVLEAANYLNVSEEKQKVIANKLRKRAKNVKQLLAIERKIGNQSTIASCITLKNNVLSIKNGSIQSLKGLRQLQEDTSLFRKALNRLSFGYIKPPASITSLDLSGNKLSRIDLDYVFKTFPALTTINVEGNMINRVQFPEKPTHQNCSISLSSNPIASINNIEKNLKQKSEELSQKSNLFKMKRFVRHHSDKSPLCFVPIGLYVAGPWAGISLLKIFTLHGLIDTSGPFENAKIVVTLGAPLLSSPPEVEAYTKFVMCAAPLAFLSNEIETRLEQSTVPKLSFLLNQNAGYYDIQQ